MTGAEIQADAAGENDANGKEPHSLWTVSAGGYSATADAFALSPLVNSYQDEQDIWFLSMVGPQTSVKAIWATLLNTPPGPAHLTPGAEGLALEEGYRRCMTPQTSRKTWTTRIAKLANGMGYHVMTYTRLAEYNFDRGDFLLLTQEEQEAPGLHHRFLDRRSSLPLHRSWAEWLWARGLENGEIEPLECLGIHAWRCVPDTALLQEDLGEAVRTGLIGIEEDSGEKPEGEEEAGKEA